VDSVTATATGAIAGVVVLGTRAITYLATLATATVALGVVSASRRIPDVAVILAAGAVGIALR
jgi:hypothetical protein